MFYDARGKLTISVDFATTDPARSSFPVCDTTEIARELGVLVIKEVAPQLTIDWRWMPPEFGGNPVKRHATIAHAHDRITFFKTEMSVVSSDCASS